jgi:hypothetical protein
MLIQYHVSGVGDFYMTSQEEIKCMLIIVSLILRPFNEGLDLELNSEYTHLFNCNILDSG